MTTEELLDLVLTNRLIGLHTSMPGRVESYDAEEQTADILPQLLRPMPDGEGGYTVEDLPVLPGVPMCHPRGGGYFAAFPMQKGDFVLVVFAERPIGNWRQKGQACNPGDLRMHHLAGAQAIPCNLYPSSQKLQDASGTDLVIGKDGTAAAQIRIKPSGIELGGDSSAVALANLVNSRISAIVGYINGHTHAVSGGTASAPTPSLAAQASVAAQNVKAT